MLTNGVSTTSKHVMSHDSWKIGDVRTYVARCSIKFSLSLAGDKAQTAWDCWLVVDLCPSRVQGERSSVNGDCIRQKCYQRQFEFRYILSGTARVRTKNRYCAVCNNLDKTESTMSYVNWNCRVGIPLSENRFSHDLVPKDYLGQPMNDDNRRQNMPLSSIVSIEKSRVTQFQKTLVLNVSCFDNNVYVPQNKSCRHVYFVVQHTPIIDLQELSKYSGDSVDMGSASVRESSLEDVDNTTTYCYVVRVDQTIVCNAAVNLSCQIVVALRETEFSVLNDGRIHDNVTDVYLKVGEFVHINESVFRCNVFSQNYSTSRKVWDYKSLPIVLSAVACAITGLCCFLVFVTYCLFGELRTLPGICTMGYVLALGVTFLMVLVGSERVESKWLCTFLGFMLHYFALTHFTWSSLIAVNLLNSFAFASTTSPQTKTRKQVILYNIIGWGIPFLVCVTCLVLDKSTNVNIDYATDKLCYLQGKVSLIRGFITPVCTIVLFNLVTFVVLVVSIHKTVKSTEMARSSSRVFNTKRKLRTFTGIFSLLGLTWILAFMASINGLDVLWYIFFVITLLHGPTLLVIFALNNRTRHRYISMFRRLLSSTPKEST